MPLLLRRTHSVGLPPLTDHKKSQQIDSVGALALLSSLLCCFLLALGYVEKKTRECAVQLAGIVDIPWAIGAGLAEIGFTLESFTRNQPRLDWLILVSQSEREALGPVRTLEHFAFLMVVLGLLMLTMLLAYFWTHRQEELANLEVLEIQRPSQGKASA